MLRCRVLGHRFRFTSSDRAMRWTCERCGSVGGEKTYPTAADAERYARAFDRRDREDLGRRAPIFGLFPLRLVRAVRQSRRHRNQHEG
jgi:hypothetical protein